MDKRFPVLTSRQTRGERRFALVWLFVHIVLQPPALLRLLPALGLGEEYADFARYAVGAAVLLCGSWGFLRRDFDPLCDRPGLCILQVLSCYCSILCFDLFLNSLLLLFFDVRENPNNMAVWELTGVSFGTTAAMAIFLAPLVEELLFRGAVFGGLYGKSRRWAYIVTTVAFALYHVAGYALLDPRFLVFALQYLPAGYLLCRCYELTDSIWSPIFLHMLVNAVSVAAMDKAGAP